MWNEEIRRARKRAGMSQTELAERMDVSQATIASWENGTRRPDLDALCRLAELFGMSTDAILGRTPPDDSEKWALREQARRDPNRRILFALAKNGSKKDVESAVALIDALKKSNPDFYDGDDPA